MKETLIGVAFAVVVLAAILWPHWVWSKQVAYARPVLPLTLKEKILEAFDSPIMYRVALAESHLVPTATNPTSSAKGLFQILDGTWKYFNCTGDPFNADDNIACAVKIYAKDGTADWNASKFIWGK